MKTKIYLIILVLCAVFAGCKEEPKTLDQLFEEQASGVVVILNEYYYELSLPNGKKFYFSGLDEQGGLKNFTAIKEEIIEKTEIMTGSGFFIDDKGTIMTNRHVVQPQLDAIQAKATFIEFVNNLRSLITLEINEKKERYAELEREKQNCYTYDYYYEEYYYDEQKEDSIAQLQAELRTQYDEVLETLNGLNALTDPSKLNITTVSKIGIAYNDTYVTHKDDFLKSNECVVAKVSAKEDVDLALLQLKNRRTPETSYIFDILGKNKKEKKGFFDKEEADNGELKINQELYMIGYNAGLILGNTKQGIKVQMTSGKLTQQPDGQRLLYSIPTVQGSSGSPVMNTFGNFVGVNFAKLNGSDNFNFGIPAKKAIDFYNE